MLRMRAEIKSHPTATSMHMTMTMTDSMTMMPVSMLHHLRSTARRRAIHLRARNGRATGRAIAVLARRT